MIDVPGAITVKDGGIDGEINNSLKNLDGCFIPEGMVCFQIKSGSFSLTSRANILNILCKPGKKGKKRELNERVRGCFAKNGTLIVVVPGWDNPEQTEDQLRSLFQAQLSTLESKFSDAKIKFWKTNQLKSLIKLFPSIAIALKGGSFGPFQSYAMWAANQDMTQEWVAGPNQTKFIDDIRAAIRSTKKEDIRVIAEPGLGKTRAVLESLRPDDLSPLVLYAQNPSGVLNSALITQIRSGVKARAVLVVDECDAVDRANLVNSLQSLFPDVTLVTIHNEFSSTERSKPVLTPEPLADEEIGKILSLYSLPQHELHRWIPWCSGSPRVAHVLGENLKENPEDITRSPNNLAIWENYIVGRQRKDSELARDSRRVLLWLSLFKKFGFEPPYQNERKAVASKLHLELGMLPSRFDEIIQHLRHRRILQGEKTLYLTPKLFHIWLWDQWWETHGGAYSLSEFQEIRDQSGTVTAMPEELCSWHQEMFSYADSAKAASVVEELLGQSGPFTVETLDSRDGSDFFLKLTESNPRAALATLERTLGKLSKERLLEFRTGRHTIVHALQMICAWRNHFSRGARILLKLAEAETEGYRNNATGTFKDLFSLAPGQVAPTETPPTERFPLIREITASTDEGVRHLGYDCLKQALYFGQFTRISGFEDQGTRPRPNFWQPKGTEWQDSYSEALTILSECFNKADFRDKQSLVKIVLERMRGLSRSEVLANQMIEILTVALDQLIVAKKEVVSLLEQTLHFWDDDKQPEVRQLWVDFKNRLVSNSFHDRLERYAGLQILTDRFDRDKNHVDQTVAPLTELAKESIESPEVLELELGWLTSDEAKNGFLFGAKLAEQDKGFKLLEMLLDAQRKSGPVSTYFLAGYLRELQSRDIERWEETFDALAVDEILQGAMAHLTWQGGNLTVRAANRILHLAQKGVIPPADFHIFAYGMATSELPNEIFLSWIDWLYYTGTREGALASLELAFLYYREEKRKPMPVEPLRGILTNSALVGGNDPTGTMSDHYWEELAIDFLKEHPGEVVYVCDFLLSNLGNDFGVGAGFLPSLLNVVTEHIPSHAWEIWQVLVKYIGPPINRTEMVISRWLGSIDPVNDKASGALELFPPEYIWDWVEQNVDERAWYLAYIVPKRLFFEQGKVCLAREMLVRYGNREDVIRQFTAHYWSGGWWGPASKHYTAEAIELEEFRKQETNPIVLGWLDKMIAGFRNDAEKARGEEERRGY